MRSFFPVRSQLINQVIGRTDRLKMYTFNSLNQKRQTSSLLSIVNKSTPFTIKAPDTQDTVLKHNVQPLKFPDDEIRNRIIVLVTRPDGNWNEPICLAVLKKR